MKRTFLIIPLFCAVSVYAADKIYFYNSSILKVKINNVSKWSGDLHKETGTLYDPNGYDKNGYDQNGFDINGIHRDTGTIYDPSGFNTQGIDAEGYNKAGFNESGYDRQGFDVNGFGVEDCSLNINSFYAHYDQWTCNNNIPYNYYFYINGYFSVMEISSHSSFHNVSGYRYYIRPGHNYNYAGGGHSACSSFSANPKASGNYAYYVAPLCRKAIKPNP